MNFFRTKIKRRIFLLGGLWFAFMASALLFSAPVSAAANSTISIQGKIVILSNGVNVSTGTPACVLAGADTCAFRVSIYDSSSGGTLLWQETRTNIELGDNGGVFSFQLNSICNSWSAPSGGCSGSGITGANAWGSGNKYMQIDFDPTGNQTFAASVETFARVIMTTVPYAYYADNAAALLDSSGNSITGDGFVKFVAGTTQTTSSSNSLVDLTTTGNVTNSLIKVNENGAGTPNLLQLQTAGVNKLVVDNNGHVQIASASSGSTTDLGITDTFAGSGSTQFFGVNSILTVTGNTSGGSSVAMQGLAIASPGLGNTNANMVGTAGLTQLTTAGTLSSAYGLYGNVQNTSTGSIGSAYALFAASNTNTGGGSITNNYGIMVTNQTVGNNNYDLYLSGASGGSGTNAALYINGNSFSQNLENLNLYSGGFTQTITGAVANIRPNQFVAPTITAGSAQTVTNAATVYVSGAPVASGSAVITNNYALWVNAGLTKLGAATTSAASLNITSSAGANPTTPNSGDLWWNGTNLNFYNGSSTVDLLNPSGSFVLFAPASPQSTASTNSLINLVTTANTANTLIVANENGAGTPNLLDLQTAGSSVFKITNTGTIGIGNGAAAPNSSILALLQQNFAGTGNFNGVQASITNTGANTSAVQGGNFNVFSQPGLGNTQSSAQGVAGNVSLTNTGTLTNAAAFQSLVSISAAGTITNAYGLNVQSTSLSGGGSIGSNYGIIVNNQTAGGTNNYGLYLSGASGGSGTNSALYINGSSFSQNTENMNIYSGGYTQTISAGMSFLRPNQFIAPTVTAGTAQTVSTAATLFISGAPSVGGSATITNDYSLWSAGGTVELDNTSTNTTAIVAGLNTTMVHTGANSNIVEGIANVLTETPGTGNSVQRAFGFSSSLTLNQSGTGSVNSGVGYAAFMTNTTGTAGYSAFQVRNIVNNGTGSSSVTGFDFLSNPTSTGGGTIGTLIGLNVANLTAGTNGNYGIYLNGASGSTGTNAALYIAASSFSQNTENYSIFSGGYTQTITTGVANIRPNQFIAPTITAGSAQTVTNAATLYVSGAPTASGSAVITNNYSLWVNAGLTKLGAATTSAASLNITSSAGVNPTTPKTGDLWWNGTNLNFYNGTTSVDLLNPAGPGGNGFVQFAPSSAQTTASTNSLINITTTANTANALIVANENGAGTPNLLNLQVAGSNKFSVNNLGNVGIGVAPTNMIALGMNETFTPLGGVATGINSQITSTGANANGATGFENDVAINPGVGNTHSGASAYEAWIQMSGPGTLGGEQGIQLEVDNNSTGTINVATGVDVLGVDNTSTGTIGTAYGVHIGNFGSTGITNDYGLYIDGATGASTQNAALYIAGSTFSQNLENLNFYSGGFTQTITGAVANIRPNQFIAPTITAATAQTVTNAATLYVSGAPIASGSAVITNDYALLINAGLTKLGAATTSAASLNITSSAGVNPTTPNSGDLWWNGTNLNFRTASATTDLLNPSGPSGNGFVQFAPSSSQSTTSANSLINIQTTAVTGNALFQENEAGGGAPNLMQLLVGGANKFVIDNNGHIAIASATVNSQTDIGISDSFIGSGSTPFYGINSNISVTSNSTGSSVGIQGAAVASPGVGNTVNIVNGTVGVSQLNTAGTLNGGYGALGRVDNISTGTIGAAYGIYSATDTNSGGGSILNVYGVYVQNQSVGTNNNIGVYVEGGSTAGMIVNTGAATAKGILVKGFTSQSANLFEIQNVSATPLFAVAGNGTVAIGISGNQVTTNTSGELLLTGTARHTVTYELNAEYPGAVLTKFYGAGTDSVTSGTMTSDTDTSGNLLRNYYNWTSTQAALNFYTVAVRVTLPSDFSAWQTGNAIQVDYMTTTSVVTDNSLDVYLYNSNDTPGTAVTSSTGNKNATWTQVNIANTSLTGTPAFNTAGHTGVIYLRMGAKSSNVVRIGDIKLNYLSKY